MGAIAIAAIRLICHCALLYIKVHAYAETGSPTWMAEQQ